MLLWRYMAAVTAPTKQAKQVLVNAVELAGGIMTTRVHGCSVQSGRHSGDRVVAITCTLDAGAALRICLSPALADALWRDIAGADAPIHLAAAPENSPGVGDSADQATTNARPASGVSRTRPGVEEHQPAT